MKYLNQMRDINLIKGMLEKVVLKSKTQVNIMEVCGTHTMAIFKSGIRELLPPTIKLISGPGCPVCVTPQSYIDTAIMLSKRKDVIITTFGDMMRVPGSESSLQREKALGGNVKVVFSPLDAVRIAKENPQYNVVFLAIGFETTAPTVALSIEMAYKENIKNYSILSSIKTMPNTMKALVVDEEININGFICPGHVSTIIGEKPYGFLAKDYNIPAVIAGFETVDILMALYSLLEMLENGEYKVKNHYSRLVSYEGNKKAQEIINNVFETSDSNWRGIGKVEGTGLQLRNKYKDFNAVVKLDIVEAQEKPIKGCICGDIIKGKNNPLDCPYFAKTCTPINPIGACMVSEEGTCAAYYKYRGSST